MKKLLLLIFFTAVGIFAQHRNGLMVMPRNIHFDNNFNRAKFVYVENNTDSAITIDSVVYNHSVYFIRPEKISGFPAVLQPHFEFSFEVIQYNYFNLQPTDSSSVVTIYNTSSEPVISLGIHQNQDMMMNAFHKGDISGTVSDSNNVISDAMVYFFYNRIVLIDSVTTDSLGKFNKELPVGDYFVAAEKDGYYIKYAFDKDSPLGADVIPIRKSTTINLNFMLGKKPVTNLDISGLVNDVDGVAVSKAVVVVRKGTHTPTKISAAADDADRSYTAFTDANGSYSLKNIKYSGDYFVQVFAPFNIPGFYNKNGTPSVFWQNADSVSVFHSMDNINLTLARDSSDGAGFVDGRVLFNNNQNTPVTDAIVYVRSVNSNKIFAYNFVSSDGNYTIPVLPYGDYELIAQKIGIPDAQSSLFSISTTQDTLSGLDISMVITSVKNDNSPISFKLYQNYPNPFNPSTTIQYSLPAITSGYFSFVQLKIYDFLGREVATFVNENKTPGSYFVKFDASNLSSGIYFYKLSAVGGTRKFAQTKKMILIK